jgi:NCAIR mutase (PurE)-related protein
MSESRTGNVGDIRRLLEQVRDGQLSTGQALERLRDLPYQDLGYALIDHHRPLRTGSPEVVLGKGKTPQQVAGIVAALRGRGHPVLVTKTGWDAYAAVAEVAPDAEFHDPAGAIVIQSKSEEPKTPGALIVTAGTADLPVAEEALLTARLMGQDPALIADVGVAGLHRLLARLPEIREAKVIIVVAGMDAALPSVIAGLVSAPVIAVPTSAGYGASFEGLAAMLAMLNSCAPGVAVVNIDNGFGAGYLAAQVNRRVTLSSEQAGEQTRP